MVEILFIFGYCDQSILTPVNEAYRSDIVLLVFVDSEFLRMRFVLPI